MSKIYLIKRQDYTSGTFKSMVEGLDLSRRMKESKRIIIKPNLTTSRDEEDCPGCTTGQTLLGETVAYIFEINPHCQVYIVESDSGRKGQTLDKFDKAFFRDLEGRHPNLHLWNLTTEARRHYDFSGQYFTGQIEMSQVFAEDYFFISMAKIKTHYLATYTGILKNQLGCLHKEDKTIFHPHLDRVLADINRFIGPDLSILDGCPAMEGYGPLEGEAVDLGLVAVSDNPADLDGYIARKTGLEAFGIPYMENCKKALRDVYGGGKVEIVNEDLADGIKTFEFISRLEIVRVRTGLFLQKIGQKTANLGRRIQNIRQGGKNGKNTETK